jgi:hypothetical protein
MLTGHAVAHVWDGDQDLGGGMLLRGRPPKHPGRLFLSDPAFEYPNVALDPVSNLAQTPDFSSENRSKSRKSRAFSQDLPRKTIRFGLNFDDNIKFGT